jgi:hypothetical protein
MEAKTRLVRQYTTQIAANWREITNDWQKLVPAILATAMLCAEADDEDRKALLRGLRSRLDEPTFRMLAKLGSDPRSRDSNTQGLLVTGRYGRHVDLVGRVPEGLRDDSQHA